MKRRAYDRDTSGQVGPKPIPAVQEISKDQAVNFIHQYHYSKVMPRLKIPGFLSRYKAGRHMDMACCEAFRGTRMRVSSLSPVVCNIDGECFSAPDIHFRALPGALSFVLPEGVRLPGRAPAVSASL